MNAAIHAIVVHRELGRWPEDHVTGAGCYECPCKPQVARYEQAQPKQEAKGDVQSAAEKLRARLKKA